MHRWLGLILTLALCGPAAAAPPPPNPWTGPVGTAGQHGDSEASDTTPLPGPGADGVAATFQPLGAVCPSVLFGTDGLPVALCTAIADRAPNAYRLDPATGAVRSRLPLTAGGLFSGVYPFMDRQNRVVVTDGSGALLRIAHTGGTLTIARRQPLPQLQGGVVGLVADFRGRTWFATDAGEVGLLARGRGAVRLVRLPEGETVGNSIASAPGGVAVTTDHAQYLLRARRGGTPRVVWRAAYNRGPGRKPGQLSPGSGSTPTFFGPRTGAEWLAIVDNASPTEHLRVFAVKDGRSLCDVPVIDGSENSPIGYDRSVIVGSTYGYPYPATPANAGPAMPASAPFAGGMTRVDVRRSGCRVVWRNDVRSSAVPKLSVPDGLVYTIDRQGLSTDATPLDRYASVAVDFATGAVRSSTLLGAGTPYDTLQLAGNVGPDNVLWQGTMTGVLRLAPAQ